MSLAKAIRQSLADFYFNSWRLAPANVLWGLGVVALIGATAIFPLSVLLVPLLAVPVAGIHRMAALIVRDEPASFSDFVDGSRRFAMPALGLGAAATICTVVLATNVLLGLQMDSPLAWFASAMAGYGLFGLAMFLVAAWPILVDPRHEHLPIRRRLWLAGLVVVGRPMRLLVVTLAVVVIFVISTLLLAVVALVAVAFAALVASHVVLPMLDDLEARLPEARQAR